MDLESYSGKLPEDYEFDLAKYCVADLYGREMLMCSLIKLPLLLKQLSGEIDFGLYSDSDIIGFFVISRYLDMDKALFPFLVEFCKKQCSVKSFEILHSAGREDGLFEQLIHHSGITMCQIFHDSSFAKMHIDLVFRLYKLMPAESFTFVRIHSIPTKEFVPQTYRRGRTQKFEIGKTHQTIVMKVYYQKVSWDKDGKLLLGEMKPKDRLVETSSSRTFGEYTLLYSPSHY